MKRPVTKDDLARRRRGDLALPFLEAMRRARRRADRGGAAVHRFFYPCGTDPRKWNRRRAAQRDDRLRMPAGSEGLRGRGIWPAETALLSDVTAVTGIDHSGVCVDIHMPSMSLSAHKGTANSYTPPQPTLDQYLADQLQGTAPYRNLALSATPSTDIGQGNISFRTGGQVSSVTRKPGDLFNTLFPAGRPCRAARPPRSARAAAEERARLRAGGRQPAERKLGAGDKQRLGQYLQAISEVEKQMISDDRPPRLHAPAAPATGGDWHSKSKLFIDLACWRWPATRRAS
jgi:hypothetical protein